MTLLILYAYLFIGFGFALASWLEAASTNVKSKKNVPAFFKVGTIFILWWPFIAVYCYRAYVKRTVPPIDWDALNK